MTNNENTNLRIKALLAEMQSDPEMENVRPYSPSQQEILKIYEDGALSSESNVPDDILKISKTAQPSKSDLNKYKLWLEQRYKSPYTGQIIPISKLFTNEYEIEHVIPQSRFFDDSLSNKVICETSVNGLKGKLLGLEFIKKHQGEKVEIGHKTVEILTEQAYEDFVQENYSQNRSKRNKLLMDEIPEKMVDRQLNDTRYISKYVSQLLSNLVREEKEDEGLNSKNVLPGNGKITSRLKQDWGLNDVWNDLILPRFERMNKITNSKDFTSWNENHQKYLPTVPLELSKGFQKKRIDHRHHAMDALVIACASRNHINLLNNKHAKSSERHDLNRILRNYEKAVYFDKNANKRVEKDIPKDFIKPWPSFTKDAKDKLENVVVSFKQNLRVINKTNNKYDSYYDERGNLKIDKDGKPQKSKTSQTKGDNWAIRKSMHIDTIYGLVNLNGIKTPKDKITTATRKFLDTSFNEKSIMSITDTGIQKILMNYLKSKENNPELAFSPEGIEDLNKNIELFNDGKPHQPIIKVRVFETGSKFVLGQSGNKNTKYVEAAKGTNLFFAIYIDEKGKRNYETIPLNVVIERQKQGLKAAPEKNLKGNNLLFYLSPNDLVKVDDGDGSFSFYKMVKASGSECYFIKANIASLIINYDSKTKIGELSSQNKLETTMGESPIRIKEHCLKIKVDRLGNISKA
jgi:CRISPR-associated endonuclease Csn1